VRHSVNERLIACSGIHCNFSSIRFLVEGVFVTKFELGQMIQLSLEGNIEIDEFILQDVRHALWIRNYAINNAFIKGELDFRNDW
jgi:hypothetical protein